MDLWDLLISRKITEIPSDIRDALLNQRQISAEQQRVLNEVYGIKFKSDSAMIQIPIRVRLNLANTVYLIYVPSKKYMLQYMTLNTQGAIMAMGNGVNLALTVPVAGAVFNKNNIGNDCFLVAYPSAGFAHYYNFYGLVEISPEKPLYAIASNPLEQMFIELTVTEG